MKNMKKILKKIYIPLICILTTLLPIKVKAEGIMLNNSSLTLGPGFKEKLGYTLSGNLDSSNIIWKSSDIKIVTVDNGLITAVASEGTAIITASINGQSSTCRVTISSNYVPLSNITFGKSSLNILVGTTEKLTISYSPSDATNKNVIWKSSDSSVATINSKGQIKALKSGTATITATASNGHQTTCKVTVVNTIPLKKITFNQENLTIKEKSSEKLNVTFSPSNATNKKVTWKSSNNQIAAVDSAGKITGVKPGTATITAVSKDGGYVAICKVTVEEISKKVTSISLDKKELKIVAGKTATLKATIKPEYAENKNIIWTSSDEKVATVENGIITSLTPGTTEIKATSEDGGKSYICKVIVNAPPLEGITFQESEQTVYLNSETELTLVNKPATAILEKAIWKSTNERVATVENGIVKAMSIGETTITVSTSDNKLTASIKISVINKPKEKLNINIEGYDLNFKPETTTYTLRIKDEEQLTINTNVDASNVTIKGNKNLKDGSIITITITDEETITYVINIKQQQSYTLYFIAAISVLLLINLIRMMIKNKKTKY